MMVILISPMMNLKKVRKKKNHPRSMKNLPHLNHNLIKIEMQEKMQIIQKIQMRIKIKMQVKIQEGKAKLKINLKK